MKATYLILVACLNFTMAAGHPLQDEFKAPWKEPDKAIVLDAYWKNKLVWDDLANEPRVAGIIHKASENLTADRKYAERKAEAKRRGYKWGSFHLGRPGDPIRQADFYIATAQPTD